MSAPSPHRLPERAGLLGKLLARVRPEFRVEVYEPPWFRWSLSLPGEDVQMAAQRKYPQELRERATRMALEARRDPATVRGAIKRTADQLGLHPEALRTWVRQAEIDEGARTGTTSEDARRIAELERENRELRRANEILRTASAFFAAAEVDRRLR